MPLGEIVPLEHARDRVRSGQAQHVLHRHRFEPLGVVAHLEVVAGDDLIELLEQALPEPLNDLFVQSRSRLGFSRRVSDASGEVAHDEYCRVAEVLELAELSKDHGPPEGYVGRGRVEPQLHPQRPVRGDRTFQLGRELFAWDDLGGIAR